MGPKQAVCRLSADTPKIEFDTSGPTAMVRTRLHFIRLRGLTQLRSIHSFIHLVALSFGALRERNAVFTEERQKHNRRKNCQPYMCKK